MNAIRSALSFGTPTCHRSTHASCGSHPPIPYRLPTMVLLLFIGCGALAAFGVPGCTGERTRNKAVKVGTVLPESHPTAASLLFFQRRIAELSGGEMTADVFFNSQIGGAQEVLELCRMGDVEMMQVSSADLSVYVPAANALAMPFLWRDSEHQFKALDGEAGRIVREKAREMDLEILGFFDAGTRNISTLKGPIRTPEDLRGRKIRVMNAPLMVATINALGAAAVAMNQGEVYTALQMGVIDGWENNPMTIATFRMYETGCVYLAWTHHFSIPDMLIAGAPFLKRLTPRQRGWVEQAAKDTIIEQRRMWREAEVKALETMKAGGMKFNEVQIQAFRDRVSPIYAQYEKQYGPEFKNLVEMIRSLP